MKKMTLIKGFNDLIKKVKENGGMTLQKEDKNLYMVEYTEGYQVALHVTNGGKELQFNLKNDIVEFIDNILSIPNNQMFGLWANDDIIYLDYKTIWRSGFYDALELGFSNNQKAIYSWKEKECYTIMGKTKNNIVWYKRENKENETI